MKTASLHSAKASLEAAEKERARLAAAKEALIAREKKEAADRKAAAERRLEREQKERQRLEDERKRQLELPKTRNLYELKKEREKRGLDANGKDDPPKAPVSRALRCTEVRGGMHASQTKGWGDARSLTDVAHPRSVRRARRARASPRRALDRSRTTVH